MIKKALAVLAACFSFSGAFSQVITATVPAGPYCPGAAITVSYTSTGAAFNPGNVFTAEISTSAGAFPGTTLTPTNTSTATAGNIVTAIPAGTATGTNYKFRVTSTSPSGISIASAAVTVSGSGFSAPTVTGTTFCQGNTMPVKVNVGCPFSLPNDFTVELSSSTGSFATPTTIGTLTNDTGATSPTINATIPFTVGTGTAFHVRVKASNGSVISVQNASALTINSGGLSAPTVTGTSFCQGNNMSVKVNVTCAFNTPNDFTVELSDNTGSFAAPTTIGTLTNDSGASGPTITCAIPFTVGTGTSFRVRVKASNGSVTSVQNTSALTINSGGFNAPTVTGTTFCQGTVMPVKVNIACPFQTPNDFTVQLSTSSGSFTSTTTIGTLTNDSGSTSPTINCTIPYTVGTGTAYRVRVVASTGNVISVQNASALTINAPNLNAPTFTGTTFCEGANLTININATCPFQMPNDFTAELSDNFGNFTTPVVIGTTTNSTGLSPSATTISATIPLNAPGGNGYRIRVKSSSGVVSPLNSSGNITVNAIALNSPTSPLSSYCAGAAYNLQITLVNGTCGFLTGNTFTAQLSDAAGNFASPLTIGTATSFTGNIPVTIPLDVPAGTGYRYRVVTSNPVTTSPISNTDITIKQFGINAPTLSNSSLCQGSPVNVVYTITGSCNFPNTPSNNVFTAQLSDASGSFATPTVIGTLTSATGGTIAAVIPTTEAAGTGYRIRVVSSNPNSPGTPAVSPDNGANVSITATVGNPTVYGTTAWNAYVYSGTTFPITSTANVYNGMYTENNLSFNTTTRWSNTSGPSVADNTTGTAYTGCTAPATNYSIAFKRTNFTCGYYQIDMNYHDDDVRVFLDGTQIFAHTPGCCDSHTNIYTGFLGPASKLDFELINFGGAGSMQVTFSTAVNPIVVDPVSTTICNTSSATLNATGPSGMTFAWTPTTGLTPSNGLGATVTAAPSATTTYTATGTDATTGCTLTKTSVVNVVSATTVPTLTVTNSNPTICSGITQSTLTVSGANTYTWTPTTGLTPSSGIGSMMVANPSATQTYTVTGNTGCKTNTATTTVTVQNPPTTPTTTFGNNVWNVYAHNNTTLSNYYGFYQETGLSFNTATKWNANTGPSVGNVAYSGCTLGGTNYSLSFKRTNFTCGYYQLNVNYQDDAFTLLVNGIQVFQNNAFTTTAQPNVWSGFLNSTSTVELQLVNGSGPGRLDISLAVAAQGPQILSAPVTICAGTSTNLTSFAAAYPAATFSWSVSPTDPSFTFTPDANQANTTLNTTVATPGAAYTVTNTMTDAGGTGCTTTKTVLVTVNPLPNTAVTPTSATIICPTQTVTLTATGANTYTWSPATGLNQTTGNVVIAQPTTTTTYTVTGNNNCASADATSTITVIPLPDYTTTYPTNTWNIYGFNSTTYGTNYTGFYTDNGSGSSGYNFDSQTRYGSTAAPSSVNATNGTIWQGCTMPNTNYALIAKRTGFTCGSYQIDIPGHDDYFTLYVNGVKVAEHLSCCDVHTNVWTGVLTTTSTIEYRMTNFGGNGYFAINVTKQPLAAGTSVWLGGTSTDWFTASNWCSAIPTATTDALVQAAGATFQPNIGASGAAVKSLTITGAVAANGVTAAIPAASLTMGAFNLDVNASWTANGTFNAGGGSVSFVSSSASTLAGSASFNDVILNKPGNGIIISTTTTQQINGTLTMTNGIVVNQGTLRFNAGSAVIGGSNSNYIDGPVIKVGNTAFNFPLGKALHYSPISISAPTNITDSYTAQYFNSSTLAAHPNSNRAVTLDHVSAAEYWTLTRTGSSNVIVTLGWNTNSGGVSTPSAMRVANWNGSFWADLGSASTTGNAVQGTVTSATAATTYGYFTFGTTSVSNQLPVTLADLQCGLNSLGNPQIDWITTYEFNSDYFEIERSTDGKTFASIDRIHSAGNSQSEQKYSFEDEHAPDGQLYYRLKQVDLDGRVVSYEVCSMKVESAGLSIYPNPTTGTATIRLHGGGLQELTVFNAIGQTVTVPYNVKSSAVELDVTALPVGVYLIRVVTGDKSAVLRLVRS